MTAYDEANRKNLKIWKKEPEAFAKMLLGFDSLQLKRVDILGDRNYHEHDGIVEGKKYLVLHNGSWHLSLASRSYGDNGWQFAFGWYAGVELRNLDVVFEVLNLPVVKAHPLGRVEQDECEHKSLSCQYRCDHADDCEY